MYTTKKCWDLDCPHLQSEDISGIELPVIESDDQVWSTMVMHVKGGTPSCANAELLHICRSRGEDRITFPMSLKFYNENRKHVETWEMSDVELERLEWSRLSGDTFTMPDVRLTFVLRVNNLEIVPSEGKT